MACSPSCFAIGLYILIRFRNIAFSVGSVVALIGDTLMILNLYLLGMDAISLEVDQTFIEPFLQLLVTPLMIKWLFLTELENILIYILNVDI